MREAILEALREDPDVAALTGGRIYARRGITGGLEPEAFTQEGELRGPALVLVMETRTRHPDDRGAGDQNLIRAVQTFALFGYAPAPASPADPSPYDLIREVHRAARRVLHRARPTPLEEPVRWVDTRWVSHGAELVEQERNLPVILARYDATITDPL